MTSMERFSQLAAGKIPDRVPVICNLLDQGAALLGMSIKEYYSKGKNVARGQLLLQEKFGYDSLDALFYVGLEAEVLGANIIFSEYGYPNVGKPIVKDYEDIESLTIPGSLESNPRFSELLECVRILKKESMGRVPVACAVTASFSLPSILMGIEKWLPFFLEERYGMEKLLEKCSQYCVKQFKALKNAGADFVLYTNPIASTTFINRYQFRKLALPWVKRDIEAISDPSTIYFSGGGTIVPLIDDIMSETGLTSFYLCPDDSISEAKKLVNGRGIVIGAYNDIQLLNGSPESIDNQVKEIMEAGKPGGGFAFATLMMPLKIPEANIRAMLNAAFRYGDYAGD